MKLFVIFVAASFAVVTGAAAFAARKADRELKTAVAAKPNVLAGATHFETCLACHGSNASHVPRIAHQHSLYIVRQMQDSADGRRPNMNGRHATLARSMSFEEFQVIADYLSRKTH
jgi:cytochrome c553